MQYNFSYHDTNLHQYHRNAVYAECSGMFRPRVCPRFKARYIGAKLANPSKPEFTIVIFIHYTSVANCYRNSRLVFDGFKCNFRLI